MTVSRVLSLDELLEVCVHNQLIDRYRKQGAVLVLEQESYVHELTPEHAHLYLQILVRYARYNLDIVPPAPRHADEPRLPRPQA
jgi:hypothetical protein